MFSLFSISIGLNGFDCDKFQTWFCCRARVKCYPAKSSRRQALSQQSTNNERVPDASTWTTIAQFQCWVPQHEILTAAIRPEIFGVYVGSILSDRKFFPTFEADRRRFLSSGWTIEYEDSRSVFSILAAIDDGFASIFELCGNELIPTWISKNGTFSRLGCDKFRFIASSVKSFQEASDGDRDIFYDDIMTEHSRKFSHRNILKTVSFRHSSHSTCQDSIRHCTRAFFYLANTGSKQI